MNLIIDTTKKRTRRKMTGDSIDTLIGELKKVILFKWLDYNVFIKWGFVKSGVVYF